MCIRNSVYMKTTSDKSYKAYRSWYISESGLLHGTFVRGSVWRTASKTAKSVGRSDGSDNGLHSLVKRAEATHGSVRGLVLIGGKVSIMGRPNKCRSCGQETLAPAGYLSSRQTILELYVPRCHAKFAAALRKRYKVPVSLYR